MENQEQENIEKLTLTQNEKSQIVNRFRLIGVVAKRIKKEFESETNKVIVSITLTTRFYEEPVEVEVLMYGDNGGEGVCALYDKNDIIQVIGKIKNIGSNIKLYADTIELVRKNKRDDVEDKFKELVELYSFDSIVNRVKQGRKNGK